MHKKLISFRLFLPRIYPSSNLRPKNRESGFTLMISLVLLTTILLIGVSLSTMATVEIRKAKKKKDIITARANARLAAYKALNLLQITAGPDQRVTAPSSIWREKNSNQAADAEDAEQHWTAVFHSQKRTWDPANHDWLTEGRTQDPANGEYHFKEDLPPNLQKQAWLVSGYNAKDKNGNYLTPKSIRNANDRIKIIEGDETSNDVEVLSSVIANDEKGADDVHTRKSRYAFYVADEGIKAKINIHENPETQFSTINAGSAKTIRDRLPLMSPRASAVTLERDDGTIRDEAEREEVSKRIISPSSLLKITNLDSESISHDFTTSSQGVLADVARGGLKKDLTRGLGDQFVKTLAGEVMWTAPLPERSGSGVIQDLNDFQSKRDKNVNKRAPEQHRGFLRGPMWDIAHSWYSLYLPKPPFIPGFYGGVEDEFHPSRKKNQKHDLIGRHTDPTIYRYSENNLNRGPKSDVRHTKNPNIDPRSPAGAHGHNWIARNTSSTTKYFTNKPFWQHSDKSNNNFKIDFTKNGYPRGSEFWRNENVRHPLAPVLIEYNMEVGMFAVDATYLWDLTSEGHENLFPYTCRRDNYTMYHNFHRDNDYVPIEDRDEDYVEPTMPRCPICRQNDQVDFTGGYRNTNQPDPRFGDRMVQHPNRRRVQKLYHLEKTKYRMEILRYLLQEPQFRNSIVGTGNEPTYDGFIQHRSLKFRPWLEKNHKAIADRFYGKKDTTVDIRHYINQFSQQHVLLDMEKHSRGLRNGNELEQAAYHLMRSMYKPVLILRPTLVYWNPYNVQLNNAHPFIHTIFGNMRSRWVDRNNRGLGLFMPDVTINTSRGPLKWMVSDHKVNYDLTSYNWQAMLKTPYIDRFTNNFTRWYGFGVPNNPNYFPFYKHDFREHGHHGLPNGSFHNHRDHTRFHYRTDIDRHSSDVAKQAPYNFAPGEIKIFTPKFRQRSRNVVMTPEGDSGFLFSIPLSTEFIRAGETIQDIELHSYPSTKYDEHGAHVHSWEIETIVQSNRDTVKQQHRHQEYMHVGRIDRLIPEPEDDGVKVTVGKTIDSLAAYDYEQYDWWGKRDGHSWHPDYGGIRPGQPQVDGASRDPDGYGGPKIDNDYFNKKLVDAVSVQEHNHFFFSYNFRRKAADSAPSDENLASWIHLNARAHDVLRNAETEGSPFGWHARVLSQTEMKQEVLSVSQGIAKWGTSFSHKGKSRIAMVDVPRQPMHSLVELTHANLGNYNMMPTFATGNSYASPFIPPNQSFTTKGKYNLIPADEQKYTKENDNKHLTKFFHPFNYTLPDVSYQLNKSLFDRYFFSTIPDWSYKTKDKDFKNMQFVARNYPPFQEFDQDFVNQFYNPDSPNPEKYLPPNPRMRYYSENGEAPDIDELHDFDSAAANLMVDGAFNVNSTSVPAWETLLQTLRGSKFRHTMGIYDKPNRTAFLRSIYPFWGSNDDWQGFDDLDDSEIRSLAEAIVDEVKKRGPFLSLSQFMNRTLVNPLDVEEPDDHKPWFSGPVQTALDKTINKDKRTDRDFSHTADYKPNAGSHWKLSKGTGTDSSLSNIFSENTQFSNSENGLSMTTGIPGWVLQSDVLRPLAPILNARSDTFTIRGYGDVQSQGNIKAKAMCELVVQRVPEYVNNNAHSRGAEFLMHNKEKETWYNPDPGLEAGNSDRNLLVRDTKPELIENFRLGRRYKIIQFRWL